MAKDNKTESMFIFEDEKGGDSLNVSPTANHKDNFIDISSFSSKGKHQKKPQGFFGKLKVWWRRTKPWQKSIMITAISLVLILSIGLSIFFSLFSYNYNSITKDPEDLGFESVINEEIVNVALFGIDTRNTKSLKGNSDSIMVLSLNTRTKKIKIISILRDSFVPIVNKNKTSYRKINSAYALGGPELAIKTINQVFGLDISEYATVNFFGMADIIDAVGGIEAELTPGEVTKNLNASAINFCINEICTQLKLDPKDYYIYKSGKQHLNGVQAVAYARIRKVKNIWGSNNDYGRGERQRYVMEQLFNKAVNIDKSRYMDLIQSLIPCSETSLSYSEILSLAMDILLRSPTFEQACIPQDKYIMPAPKTSAGAITYFDLEFAKELMYNFIYEDITPDEYIEINGVEKNDWYGKLNISSGRPTASKDDTSSEDSGSSDTAPESSEIGTGSEGENDQTDSSSEEDGKNSSENETSDGSESSSGEGDSSDGSENSSGDSSSSSETQGGSGNSSEEVSGDSESRDEETEQS